MKLTNLTKKDFEKILSNYEIGDYKSHKYIFTGGNTVYKLITFKGNFLLKVYETASLGFVNYQIELMEFLKKTNVSTPPIMNTKNGRGLFIYHKKRMAIQKFVNGIEVQYPNENLAEDMGRKYGIMNKVLFNFKKRVTKKEAEYPDRLVKWNLRFFGGFDLQKESKLLFQEIQRLNKKKLRKSLIHGDLCEGNFLVEKNKVSAIIDWDDVYETYLVYELATPIAHNFITLKKINKELIRVFLKEYQKYIRLNSEEKKALYFFVKHRELSAGSWCVDQIKKHPDRKDELMKWTNTCIKKYKLFSNLSLAEFLELLNS